MQLVRSLMTLTDAYCAARGVSAATVSGIIFKNSRTLPRIRNGGDLATRNYERAVRWFGQNWPEGHDWPISSERPDLLRREGAA